MEFSRIHEIKSIRLLVELLRERVGSPLSYTSIAEDLQIAPNTVRKYIDIFETLYRFSGAAVSYQHRKGSVEGAKGLFF